MLDSCPLCNSGALSSVILVESIPAFQNKVYSSAELARSAATGKLALMQCGHCGFVFNAAFNAGLMHYDINYQNEQNHSNYFKLYLQEILNVIEKVDLKDKKILEIGCGKGFFLEMLRRRGYDVWGIDPTYEGSDPKIIKDYYSEKYKDLNPDFLILRHTLEHIDTPAKFLQSIRSLVRPEAKIFIEVPDFDWIVRKHAFWDLHFEHCNYFTIDSLSNLFDSCESGLLFGDQYMYVLGVCGSIRQTVPKLNIPDYSNLSKNFEQSLIRYKNLISEHPSLALWGAGAKGSTFSNLLDTERKYIRYIIDINPKKQYQFLGGTGHAISPPERLEKEPVETIFVMNENYLHEIAGIVKGRAELICI
jgi:SAM-dependent methyltransferase